MDIELIGLLFKIFVGIIAVYAFWRAWSMMHALSGVFEDLASRHGGQVSRRWFFDFPTLTLTHGGRRIQVSISFAAGGEVLKARVHFPIRYKSPIDLQLLPENALERMGTKLGFQDISIGNRKFDRAYLLKAKPVDAASLIITGDLQQTMVAIRDLNPEMTVREDFAVIETTMFLFEEPYSRLLAAGFKLSESITDAGG